MITSEAPYKVGDIIKWGFSSCYQCHVEEYGMHVWCGGILLLIGTPGTVRSWKSGGEM
jgi:hypothetical protein